LLAQEPVPLLAFLSTALQIVTRDATAAAGAPDMCANNTRLAFKALLSLTNVTEVSEARKLHGS
jgi:hypothetical protein